jgi:hypothetical protein
MRDSNESEWTSMVHGLGHGETWGLLSNLGGFVTYQDTYPMNLACIVHVSCMYLDFLTCSPFLYIKHVQLTSRSM